MAMFDSPYEDSYYYNPTGGTDADFLAYLKRLQAERKGGILGGGMFGRMGEAEKKAVNANDVLGELINKQTSSGSSGGDGGSGGNGSDSFFASEGNNPYDRITDRTYVPGLWGIDQVVDMFDAAAIRSELKKSGYSEAEIDRLLQNPEIAKALHSTGRIDSEYLSRPYDYNESGRDSNILKAMGRELGITETPPANQYPLSPYNAGLFGANVMVGSDVYNPADIANIREAQMLGNNMTFRDINSASLMNTANARALQGAADAQAREEAARVAAAAAEAARLSEAQRQARLASTTSSISGGGTDGSSIGWSSPSDSVSSGRTSSSDISYSASRDRTATTGYDFNKD